jgi:RNA polymerase sigma-B factor
VQWRYGELVPDDPEWQRLRDALINGYAPVAKHLARRFAGRGELLEDLIQVATVGLINAVDRPGEAAEYGAGWVNGADPSLSIR